MLARNSEEICLPFSLSTSTSTTSQPARKLRLAIQLIYFSLRAREERAFLCNVTTRRAWVSRFDHRAWQLELFSSCPASRWFRGFYPKETCSTAQARRDVDRAPQARGSAHSER